MGKLEYPWWYVDARGTLGNEVASKNNSGPYSRAWISTPNPDTSSQQDVRTFLTTISQNWSTLSESERQSWRDLNSNSPRKNVFKEQVYLNDKNFFTSRNLQALNAGFSALTSAPTNVIMPVFKIVSAVFTRPPRRITITLDNDDPAVRLIIYATDKLPQAAYSWKKSNRIILDTVSTSLPTNTVYNAYRSKFSHINFGDNIFIGIKKVLSNGQTAPIQMLKMIT